MKTPENKPNEASRPKTIALILLSFAALRLNPAVQNMVIPSCVAQVLAITAAARIYEPYEEWQLKPVYFFAVLKHTFKYSAVMLLNVGVGISNDVSATLYGLAAASLFLSGVCYAFKKCLYQPKPDNRTYEERRAESNLRQAERELAQLTPTPSVVSDIDTDSDSDSESNSDYGDAAGDQRAIETIQTKRDCALFLALFLPAIATSHSAFMAYRTGELKYQLSGQICLAFLASIWKRKYKFHHHPTVGLSSALFLTGRYAVVMLINGAVGATEGNRDSMLPAFLMGAMLITPMLFALKNHYRKRHDFQDSARAPATGFQLTPEI